MWNDPPDRHTRYEAPDANGLPDRQTLQVNECKVFSKIHAGYAHVSWRNTFHMVK